MAVNFNSISLVFIDFFLKNPLLRWEKTISLKKTRAVAGFGRNFPPPLRKFPATFKEMLLTGAEQTSVPRKPYKPR
jgi:hypothetical protein